MADTLTPQQRLAVENRGGKLLVSAAAGSGKTKVLVDRLMGYVLDPVEPANLDDFLIITYTKAAAAELRGKIANKLAEHIAAQPDNRHLQRQMQRLYLAKISTVHAWCSELLREYAYHLDIPADFRVADEPECRELRDNVINAVLESAYARASEEDSFRALVDTQGLGRDDRQIPEIVFRVYDSARCHLNPEEWLDACIRNAQVGELEDASQTVWGQYLMGELFSWLDEQLDALASCVELSRQEESLEKVTALLQDTLFQLQQLRSSETWDQVVQRKEISFGRLTFPRKVDDPTVCDRIKAVRNHLKEELGKHLRPFADSSEQILSDLQGAVPAVEGLVALVRQFGTAYAQAKRHRRVLDFSDLEHQTLNLLLGKSRQQPTRLALEIGSRFREVMVDEYQDSNGVQDAIFSALTGQRQNCFMVGDVKQSIYQFRLADPGIFVEKYEQYPLAEDAQPGEGRKVLLSSNFRSGEAVLEATNDVFTRCMSPSLGGLAYTEAEALREGLPHEPLGEPEVELHGIPAGEDVYAAEAGFTADRILSLLDGTHMVRGSDGLRPIVPEDIVILLRSPGSVGSAFQKALHLRGIRCVTGRGQDLLETAEISVLRGILQILVNPRQDIPLISVLMSPVFCFTAEDMARLRSRDRHSRLYDVLEQDEEEKSKKFVAMLNALRQKARLLPLSELLEQIFAETRLDSIYAAMLDAEHRSEHLQQFYALAVSFEATGRRDVQQFLDHLDALAEKGLTVEQEPDRTGAVTIMSIHKSKGLEFPVVFLCGLARRFNTESQRAQVMIDSELGLGLSALDAKNRIRYPTLAKSALAAKAAADSRSEELRVLYVAMTRARDRLIMTYAAKSLEKELTDIAQRMGLCADRCFALEAGCPGDWVLLEAMHRSEAGAFFALGGYPPEAVVSRIPWHIAVSEPRDVSEETDVEQVRHAMFGTPEELPRETVDTIREALRFRYAHEAATRAPSKQTATQRKGRSKDQEAAEQAPEVPQPIRTLRKPSFVCPTEPQGKTVGNAMHAAMQYLRYAACTTEADTAREVQRLVSEGLLTEEQGNLIRPGQIAAFFQTEPGQKLACGVPCLREFKFSVLDDGSRYGEGLEGEQVLLQGVVDCALLEPEGITVLDFKTDYVTEDTLPALVERYAPQVEAYGEALSRIYAQPVIARMLYFFRLNRLVAL